MSRKISEEGRMVVWFHNADLVDAERMLGVLKEVVRDRQEPKAPKPRKHAVRINPHRMRLVKTDVQRDNLPVG